jgi:hypothetical protein
VTVTFFCEVVSVRLAQDFRMGALQLRPIEEGVVMHMNSADATMLPPEKDFHLGQTELSSDGRIETLRLIPASRAEQLPVNGSGAALNRLSGELRGERKMRVQLIADFEILRVELADTFGVDAVVVRSHDKSVRVQTGENSAVAMQFYIHDVQLDENGLLASLIVGSRR